MGNQSSSAQSGAQQTEGQAKIDYYELLSVDRQATDDEIKKAYRKKALELHPDRNYGNVENATKLFAEIQSAYEVLSDPQERGWYDSHRDAILRSENAGDGGEQFSYNVRITTADEILALLLKFNGRLEYTDAPSGFYGGLRDVFERVAREEELACEWEGLDVVEYPPFGHKDDDYEDVVRPFYAAWNGFATKKTFSWKDVYRYTEAPDRRVRRLMEKENKRLRDEGIREFNDAVRSLIAFVRKRDPRYKANSQSEAERQKALRDAAMAQAARSRAANEAKIQSQTIPDWAKPEEVQEESSSEEESEQEHFECLVCAKTFKSERQFEAHERSKKHIKGVKQLRREMREEDELLGHDGKESNGNATLQNPATEFGTGDEHDANQATSPTSVPDLPSEIEDSDGVLAPTAERPINGAAAKTTTAHDNAIPSESEFEVAPEDVVDDYASREAIERRITSDDSAPTHTAINDVQGLTDSLATSSIGTDSDVGHKKVGKAKQKRAKKVAQKAAGEQAESEFTCAAYQAGFPSKTRLFNHIKELNHAQPVSKSAKAGKGGKRHG